MAGPMRQINNPKTRFLTLSSSIRSLTISRTANAQVQQVTQAPVTSYIPPPPPAAVSSSPSGSSSWVQRSISSTYFEASGVLWVGLPGQQPPDPNKAKLGKSTLTQHTSVASMSLMAALTASFQL